MPRPDGANLTRIARTLAADLAGCLRFYARLPMPTLPFEAEPHAMLDFATAVRMLPVAGFVIGLPAAAVLGLTSLVHLPPTVGAALGLATLLLTTGAFHEDGLADMADGFGGGHTRDRKLEIMKDSRLGSYGAAALIMSLLLRWAALAALLTHSLALAMAATLATAAVSRVAGLIPLMRLAPARADGAAYAAARPTPNTFVTACGLALCISLLPVMVGAPIWRCVVGCIGAALVGLGVSALSHHHIQGQTGDVAGAAQQGAEAAYLCALLLALG